MQNLNNSQTSNCKRLIRTLIKVFSHRATNLKNKVKKKKIRVSNSVCDDIMGNSVL